MGRPKSVILTPAELKTALGTNNAQLKDLKARLKTAEATRANVTKDFDRAVKVAEKTRDAALKIADKDIKSLSKDIAAVEAKNAKLNPAPVETKTS